MIEIVNENYEQIRRKQCTKCEGIKLFSDFHKQKDRMFGLMSQCKECRKKQSVKIYQIHGKMYYDKNKEKMKQCTICREIKSFSKFDKQKGRKFGLTSNCKKCRSVIGKRYRENNKEKIREKSKRYCENNKEKLKEYRAKNKEKIREKDRICYQKNKGKLKEYQKRYKEENEEKVRENSRKYYHKNREKISKYYELIDNSFPESFDDKCFCQECRKELTIRQIRIHNLFCSMQCSGLASRKPEIQDLRKGFRGYNWRFKRKIIRERDNYTCQVCGEEENGLEHDVHHIVSWHSFSDKLEANNNSNLITLCQSCHRKYENDNSFIPIFLRIVEENELFFLSKIKQSEMIES